MELFISAAVSKPPKEEKILRSADLKTISRMEKENFECDIER
jgi:hypothetical protein